MVPRQDSNLTDATFRRSRVSSAECVNLPDSMVCKGNGYS